jgi:shikimate kinase
MANDVRQRSIFLIGPMGAGKSTIGRALATRLDKVFVDADRELEERTGASISLIFEIEGEASFRSREARLLEELTRKPDVVLATGGGAVLSAANRRYLRARGLVVYLRAPIEQLIARTRRDRRRPLLNTADPEAKLTQLLAERDPLYRETADMIIDTENLTVRRVVNLIQRELKAQCGL